MSPFCVGKGAILPFCVAADALIRLLRGQRAINSLLPSPLSHCFTLCHRCRRLAVHVAQVGAWLTAAKAKCQHGEWLPWLADNCAEISQQTASNYMRLYDKAASNYQLIGNLTPTQAYKELGVVRNNNGFDWYQSSDSGQKCSRDKSPMIRTVLAITETGHRCPLGFLT